MKQEEKQDLEEQGGASEFSLMLLECLMDRKLSELEDELQSYIDYKVNFDHVNVDYQKEQMEEVFNEYRRRHNL